MSAPPPKVDPVPLPDVVTEPHAGTAGPTQSIGPLPDAKPGLAEVPGIEASFKPLPELAKPHDEATPGE